MNTKEKIKRIMYVLIVVALLGVSFTVTGGLVWLVCWAFSLPFSWKITLGIWIIWFILNGIFYRR